MTATYVTADHLDPWTPDERDWRHHAACGAACRDPRDPARPGWWDAHSPSATDPTDDNLAAIDVCAGCTVVDQCLDAAHPRHDAHSIRAGMLPPAWRTAKREGSA